MTIAPQNPYPEQQQGVYERTIAPSITGNKGPLRFQEGVQTDTDVPNDFVRGAYGDTAANGRFSHPSREMFFKHPEETMRERAHMGSASWIEAPELLGDFVTGTAAGDGPRRWEQAFNSGLHMNRPNPVRVDG